MTVNRLQEVVSFRDDRLFDGAIDLEWLIKDKPRAIAAAESFVFHGPTYHGVTQQDVGTSHGHHLIDTATFTLNIIRRCNGSDDQPFTLAIAGYGTGKSHLAVTLASLLSDPFGKESEIILSNIEMTDAAIGKNVRQSLNDLQGPALVISLNGMGNYDLASEFTRQVMIQLHERGIDSKALDDLRPRFNMASNLIQYIPEDEVKDLTSEFGITSKSDLVEKLLQHDEIIYGKVYEYFANKGIPIKAIGDETVKDVLETICREYCGDGKPFSQVVVLFDEFGRYAEFATVRSQIAGSGVLQHLFEGIQSNSAKATFVGFIQFDLNTYVQRMGQEYRNEILRVSTRYQSADKAYLSINLETLIANLLEKKNPEALYQKFDQEESLNQSGEISRRLLSWFPRSAYHHLWSNVDQFHQIIRKGCWPLSPFATWFLYHLAAAGQHLQQRSALALLGEAFKKNRAREFENLGWEMSAVDLWSDALQNELLTSEESGSLGTTTISYVTVMARNEQSFAENERRMLRAIVIGSKLGLTALDRNSAVAALAALSGIPILDAGKTITKLEDEYNVITWDQSFKQFEILGDSVSRPAFLNFLRQRASIYDEHKKSQLFVRRGQEWGSSLLADQTCDFAENHRITTTEWRFEHLITNLEELQQLLIVAMQNWATAYPVDKARGTIIYCYLEPNNDLEKTTIDISKLLREKSHELEEKALPILIVLLHDEKGLLGQYMAELDILDQLNEQEKARFGNLIGSHRQKCNELFTSQLEALIKRRNYATAFIEPLENIRLSQACNTIFEHIYNRVLSFPFDGFSTARGNAADSCMALTIELLNGILDFQTVSGKAPKEKNRAIEVLRNTWKIFNTDGQVSRRPSYEIARAIINEWEDQLKEKDGRLNLGNALKSVCKPPFGANIASAGLLLGVFIRARRNDLSAIVNEQPTDFSRLIADGIFHGKFLDLRMLESVVLAPASTEGVSEWDKLFDEWEQASNTSYKELIEIWHKANNLRARLPLPPAQAYRYKLYSGRAKDTTEKIKEFGKKVDDALSRIEHGCDTGDLRVLTYGGAQLKDLQDEMRGDPMWDSESATAYDKEIENVRQLTIQMFDIWLRSQSPIRATTKDVSEFERKMLVETGRNLNKLGLKELFEKLRQHVDMIVRKINLAAQAHELVYTVSLWLTEHETMRIVRVADLRDQRDTARDFSQRISEMNRKIPLPELDNAKNNLSLFLQNIKDKENEINKRATKLMDFRFNVESMDSLIEETEDLERIYEGCDSDLQDLRLMRRSLHFYRDAFKQLSSEVLTESEFEKLAKSLEEKGIQEFGKEEPPWMPEKTIAIIVKHISSIREHQSKKWIGEIEPLTEKIINMDITEANDLYKKISNPPLFISSTQKKQLLKLLDKVEDRLNVIKIDWLVKRYEELDSPSRRKFLQLIAVKIPLNN